MPEALGKRACLRLGGSVLRPGGRESSGFIEFQTFHRHTEIDRERERDRQTDSERVFVWGGQYSPELSANHWFIEFQTFHRHAERETD